MMAPGKSKSFQLLEINIMSAQDLAPVSKNMKTYARVWVNPGRKLLSCVDAEGNNNPTWNDKFVFRVDEDFLMEDTSAVMIEIYASHWLRDVILGTVRVLVGNLIAPSVLSSSNNHHIGMMRFVALQVRRPSGRPQGILNMGVALLDASLRSMPLYAQEGASAVGYRDLMQDPPNLQQAPNNLKPILHRSRSERSEHVALDNYSPNSSIIALPTGKNKRDNKESSSILSISEFVEYPFKGMPQVGKASSVISGAELRDPKRPTGMKSGSVISDSVYSKESSRFYGRDNRDVSRVDDGSRNEVKKHDDLKLASDGMSTEIPTNKVVDEKFIATVKEVDQNAGQAPRVKDLIAKFDVSKGLKNEDVGPFKGNSVWSDSDVGPSASEVAAVMAERRHPLNDNQSSVLDGWSVDESVEGLRSKLERWRMDLPPVYDTGSSSSSYKSLVHRNRGGRKRSRGRSGMFSCFGNICGYECQFVFGKPPRRRIHGLTYASSSVGSPGGRSFL